jgi:hypothetical protein
MGKGGQTEQLPLELTSAGITDEAAVAAVNAGLQVLNHFLQTFNERDAKRWAQTLNYPHIRLATGKTQVWQSALDYEASNDIAAFAETGWDHTEWDRITPVQADADKVHFTVQFTRYTREGKAIASFKSLYIVTRQDGHWGVQFRSSYAGVVQANSAF